MTGAAYAGMDEAKTFLDKEIGDLSTLPRADQEKEMQWFVDAAKPFAGMDIRDIHFDQKLAEELFEFTPNAATRVRRFEGDRLVS